MEQHPQFGNWESGENVPYTTYFENARKKKDTGRMNPDDPQDNTSPIQAPRKREVDLKGQMGTTTMKSRHERRRSHDDGQLRKVTDSPLRHDAISQMPAVDLSQQRDGGVRSGNSKTEMEAPKGSDLSRPRHDRKLSREEVDFRKPTDSPLQHESVGRRAIINSPHRLGSPSTGETPKRTTRQSAGSDRSIDQSPLHPNYQPRVVGKASGVSSPSWERKRSSEGSHGLSPSTPGRSRLRSVTRGDDTPDHSPAVPIFGDWDESDPASAEGYTHIFNKVREEKQSGAGKVPAVTNETSYSNGQRHYGNDSSKSSCCFPWCRK